MATGSLLVYDIMSDIPLLFQNCFAVGIGLGFFALLFGWCFGWAVKLIFKSV